VEHIVPDRAHHWICFPAPSRQLDADDRAQTSIRARRGATDRGWHRWRCGATSPVG
jgi:hypothetical protein